MALDEALFEAAAKGGSAVWRMYQWDEPTLSLGYFQNYTRRWTHEPSRRCPAVRRLTGGGAILHDRELTYSLVVPEGHPLAVRRDRLYQAVHATLIDVLAQWGIRADFHAQQSGAATVPEAYASCGGVLRGCGEEVEGYSSESEGNVTAQKPFLCFLRRSGGDLVVGSTKVVGSAQRRRGAVLQHGSILLQRSPAAPDVDSLEDATAKCLSPHELIEAWLPLLSERLDLQWHSDELEPSLVARATELEETRYRSPAWVEHRNRELTIG